MVTSKLNIQSVCSYFHIACTLFLFGAIPFYYSSFLQYGLIFFFVSFAADYLASKRWQQGFALDKTRIVSLLVLLQFVLLFVYSFFEADTRYLSTIYEYRTSFLGFGLIGLLGVSDKFRVRHFAYTVPLAVIAFLIVLYGYLPESFFQLDLKKKLVEISYYRSLHICAHMQLNIFLCAGMMLFSKLITITKSKLEKVFSILMIVFLYVLILSTQARVGIVNASVVLVFIILRFTIKKLKYLIPTIAVLLTLGLGMALFLLSDNPIKKDIPVLNRTNPREFIWQDGVDLIKESPLLGVGAGTNALRVKEKLLADEQLCSMEWFLIMHLKKEHVFGMHTHNQIMQSWQEYGIIGLVAILALWGSVIWASRRSLTLNVIFLVILVQLITEVIDGGVTSIGFCFYIYLILLLLNSGEVGRDKKLLN